MNSKQAKAFLPLVAALAEGKIIQYQLQSGAWQDLKNPSFATKPEIYRVKPEPEELFVLYSKGEQSHSVPDEGSAKEWVQIAPASYSYKRFREVV